MYILCLQDYFFDLPRHYLETHRTTGEKLVAFIAKNKAYTPLSQGDSNNDLVEEHSVDILRGSKTPNGKIISLWPMRKKRQKKDWLIKR